MKVFTPEYYHKFRCIAGDCPDSCCKEWAVDVDSESAAFYRTLPGPLGDRLREVLVDEDNGTVMTIVDGRCPMWRQDGLCRIQAELDHDALCQTCREFPRIRHEFDEFTELGLELSCPEAARLILNTQWDMELPSRSEDSDLDLLLKSRSIALELLDTYPTQEALAVILVYAHHVQAALDGGDWPEMQPESYLLTAKKLTKDGEWTSLLQFFGNLEILTSQWKCRLEQPPSAIDWSPALRAFMRYMILRYWLQTISDFDLVCRVKFAVVACLIVGAMGNDPISTAQLFSKEIENNPDNIDAILDSAYSSPALTDQNLFSLLLS